MRRLGKFKKRQVNASVKETEGDNKAEDYSTMLSASTDTKPQSERKARKTRSVVWFYFDKSPTDPYKSTCKLCDLVCNNATNTTNLFSHLRVKHPEAYEEARAQKDAEMESKPSILGTATISVTEKLDRKPFSSGYFKDKSLKRPRSVVWYYFDKDPIEALKAKCKICGTLCMHGTNTTNLFNHLKVKHPSIHDEARAQKSVESDLYLEMKGNHNSFVPKIGSITEPPPRKRGRPPKSKTESSDITSNFIPTLTPASSIATGSNILTPRKLYTSSKSNHGINKLLMNMIASNLLPPSFVDMKGFKEFVRALDNRYELPSKQTIMKKLIPELVGETKSRIKLEVHIASYFTLTVESWTYRESQICITMMAHFIKESWEPVSIVLETFDCTEKNTSESIGQEMKRITDEWGVSDKIVSVISDRTESNIVMATDSNGWEQMACFGQMLNSVILTAMESVPEIARIQKKTSEVVTYFHQNVKASDTLMSVQQHHNLPEHRLKQEVVNRWNSTYYMMERMVEQFEAVNTVLCYLGRDSICLCDDEVELMRLVIRVLQPFEAASKELFTDEYAAMSKVIPLTTLLQQVTATVNPANDSPETLEPQASLRNALLQQMETQFANLENNYTLAVTTLLDPRFKHHAFTDSTALETAQNRLLQDIISTAAASAPNSAGDSTSNLNTISTTNADNSGGGSVSIWNIFDRKVSEAGAQKSTSSEADNESRRYFKEAIISRTSNPLHWWRLNQIQFPHLKVLAQKYLCIPANAMCSSRLITKKGEDFELRRNQIKPSSLHAMVFLSSNVQ